MCNKERREKSEDQNDRERAKKQPESLFGRLNSHKQLIKHKNYQTESLCK